MDSMNPIQFSFFRVFSPGSIPFSILSLRNLTDQILGFCLKARFQTNHLNLKLLGRIISSL